MAQETDYKIPEDILALTKRHWANSLRRPFDELVKHMYENKIGIYEYKRRKIGRTLDITENILGKSLESVIKYLSSLNKEAASLDISCGEQLVLRYAEEETDNEWAQRIYYNVLIPLDWTFERARNKRADLLKEKQNLEKRLKEINNLL